MVMGKGGTLVLDPASPPLAATVILDAAAGQCGDAAFPPAVPRVCKTTGRGKGLACSG